MFGFSWSALHVSSSDREVEWLHEMGQENSHLKVGYFFVLAFLPDNEMLGVPF